MFWQPVCGVDQVDCASGGPTRLVRCGVCGRLHRCPVIEIPRTPEDSNSAVDQPSSVSDLSLPLAEEDEQDWSLVHIPLIEPQESEMKEEDISESEPPGPLDLNLNPLSLDFSPLNYLVLCEHDGQQRETFGFAVERTACIRLVGSWVASLLVLMSGLCWFGFIWASPGKCNTCPAVYSHHTCRLGYLWQLVVRCLRSYVGLSPEDRWEIMTRTVDGDMSTSVANPV